MPWEVRWLTVARALSGASGRLRGSYGAPGREGEGASGRLRGPYGAPDREGDKIASGVVRLWVAGRRSGEAVVARGIGLFPLAVAATA